MFLFQWAQQHYRQPSFELPNINQHLSFFYRRASQLKSYAEESFLKIAADFNSLPSSLEEINLLARQTRICGNSSLEAARVVVLLETHHREDQQRFHAKVLEIFYKYAEGDSILLEDGNDKSMEKIDREQICYFQSDKIDAEGWVPSEALYVLRENEKRNRETEEATKTIYQSDSTAKARIAAYERLCFDAAKVFRVSLPTKEECEKRVLEGSDFEKSFSATKTTLSVGGRLRMSQRIKIFKKKSFSYQQEGLVKKIEELLSHRRKIFVIAGSDHFNLETSPYPREEVEIPLNFMRSQNLDFIILDANRL